MTWQARNILEMLFYNYQFKNSTTEKQRGANNTINVGVKDWRDNDGATDLWTPNTRHDAINQSISQSLFLLLFLLRFLVLAFVFTGGRWRWGRRGVGGRRGGWGRGGRVIGIVIGIVFIGVRVGFTTRFRVRTLFLFVFLFLLILLLRLLRCFWFLQDGRCLTEQLELLALFLILQILLQLFWSTGPFHVFSLSFAFVGPMSHFEAFLASNRLHFLRLLLRRRQHLRRKSRHPQFSAWVYFLFEFFLLSQLPLFTFFSPFLSPLFNLFFFLQLSASNPLLFLWKSQLPSFNPQLLSYSHDIKIIDQSNNIRLSVPHGLITMPRNAVI